MGSVPTSFAAFLCTVFSVYATDTLTAPGVMVADSHLQTSRAGMKQGDSGKAELLPEKSPVLVAILSAVIPGAGLFYTKEYVRAPLVIAAEAALGYSVYSFGMAAAGNRKSLERLQDSAAAFARIDSIRYDTISGLDDSIVALDTAWASTIYRVRGDTARFARDQNNASMIQSAAWLAGCHLYSIMKAVETTGHFRSDSPRDPVVAGWLSAVPFLGMGQLYNGSLAKAGVVWMTHASLASIALTNQLLMVECEDNIASLVSCTDYELSPATKTDLKLQWEASRSKAFTDRNTFLWYFLLFYFYGIFDAVVDAHLHDYPAKMRIQPDLEPSGDGVKLNISWKF